MSEPFWHSRGYLPHWEAGEISQSITFRLANSLPAAALQRLEIQLQGLTKEQSASERRKQIESLLDQGMGETLLAQQEIAGVVEKALLHFDAQRYRLHCWCIMPNHVHVMLTPFQRELIWKIVHSWKSYTGLRANVLLHRQGPFWAREYHDRYIRDEAHYANAASYIANNPVKAMLCASPDEWRYSSFWRGRT